MKDFDFNKVIYKKPYLSNGDRHITQLIGIDSETLISGKPFIVCTSLGDTFQADELPGCFFSQKYRNKIFAVYPLKFDSGSFLHHLPGKQLNELRITTVTEYNDYRYKYIPHKMLRITRGKNSVTFYDIFQFYGMSLDNASSKYLGKRKKTLDTKRFTRKYVTANYNKIRKYCTHDANLTGELGMYLIKKLNKLGIYPNNLYSVAAVSFKYFKQNSNIKTAYRFWRTYKELLEYACNSYRGGKFEVTARGRFTGYEYDINSAYAAEVAVLLDISRAHVYKSKVYDKNATYGFMRVYIEDTGAVHHPVVVKIKDLNIFPAGSFNAYITKQEYEFLLRYGVDIKIIDAWYLKVDHNRYMYYKPVKMLNDMKNRYKNSDPMLYEITKNMLVAFYGKMAQVIRDHNGNLNAGIGWNPIYAAIVTANVRIKISELQNRLGKKCLAVHTDSIISTDKLPDQYLGDGLGKFKLEAQGSGVLIACGIYQIGSKCAYRGFPMRKGFSWLKTLASHQKQAKFELVTQDPLTWYEACHLNRLEDINKFITKRKEMDLNGEKKRVWLEQTTGAKMLAGLEYSIPRVHVE